MNSLEHHGIKGQKWGVRRFQNPDGTRTDKGKKQEKLRRLKKTTSEDFVSIRKTLSNDDLRMLNYSDSEIKYMRKNGSLNRDPITSITAHRVIQKDKNGTPVTYVEGTGFTANSLLTGKAAARIISIDLATRSGEEYRGKGYAVAAGKKMVKWFDRYGYKEYEYMEWAAKEKNIASQKTAEKLGFNKLDIAEPGWTLYTYAKHSLLGGNMNYIYGNTLVLGDSSYLEHHGIKGQRWGVRRFQNKDGSLTNAGRKRLGYSTKDVKKAVIKGGKAVGGAVATVGKTGYKLGKKAVVAAKARSDRKKAEKLEKKKQELEKKKEEASKTRLGVVRNADLFTAAEMAELNKKFKAKDELTLASLQKGADYFRLAAGMVGSVASINKDFESMTGKSLIPNPVKKEREKREADERAEDRARKLAKEDAEEDRKRRADERKSRADDIDFKNKSEDLKNKKSEELRKQAAEARAREKQTWDEAQAAEKTRAMKGVADENEAKAAIKRQELKTNEIAQREEAVAKREAAADESEERINYARKEVLKRMDDADTYRDALIKATDMLRNASDLTRQQQDEVWEFIKKAQKDKLGHDGMHDLYLEHHGIKGQRWGVRRFQNADGTLTDKGRKHYQKKLDREKRKQVSSDAIRGTLERQHGLAVGASGIITGVAGALSVAAVASNPVTIAAGAAIAAAVSSGITHGSYSIAEAWEGRGSRIRKKKIAKYENMLKQDGFIVEDGTLYLEHFGIKNMKWGVRRFQNKDGSLTEAGRKRYGSGNDGEELSGGGGGGGAPEEDEEMKKKIEEAAKKAGMSVAEYRKKYANVIANMKQAAKERKEGSQYELAKEAIYGKKEDHLPVLDNKLKLQGPKDAKEAMERYARSAESSRKAADAAYEYEKNNTNSRKDFDKWRNARYLGDSKFDQSVDAEETARRAQAVYNNSKQAKIDEAKRKGAKAIADLKRNTKQTAKNVGSKLYDSAGGYHKKEAEEYAKAADDTLRYAQSVDRKGDADLAKAASARRKGNTGAHSSYATYGGNAKLAAKKEYERASALRAGASESKEKYEKSLAGRYDKLKATMAERGKAKKKDGGARTHVLPKMKSATATAKPMRKLTSKELAKIRSEARIKQLKKDGDYTGEYKKKRRK